jgi:hypothetical protein
MFCGNYSEITTYFQNYMSPFINILHQKGILETTKILNKLTL